MKQRFDYIDLLRAFSILGVMVIHTLSFSLSNQPTVFIWNFLQFVVAVFIFCSGFVHGHYLTKLITTQQIFSWYKKRAVRILIPFYVYLAVHSLLFLLFPQIFTHFGLQKNTSYILRSIFLYGGINTNWLPVLFLELTLLTPLLFFLYRKKILWIYVGLALLFIVVGTIHFFPYSLYRILMWVGWSLVFLLGLFSEKFSAKSTRVFVMLAILGGVLSAVLFFIWSILGQSINFTDNKYPPNLYYLSYAVSMTSIAFLVSRRFASYIPKVLYEYVSQKSYSLFFIHYLVLDFLLFLWPSTHDTIFLLISKILLVIMGSLSIQKILDLLGSSLVLWKKK